MPLLLVMQLPVLIVARVVTSSDESTEVDVDVTFVFGPSVNSVRIVVVFLCEALDAV